MIEANSELTNLTKFNITVDAASTLPLSQFTSVTNCSLTVEGGSYALANLTNVNGSSLYVEDGGSLTLPDVSGYSNQTNQEAYLQATGAGSTLNLPELTSLGAVSVNLEVQALQGGQTNLPSLAMITSTSPYVQIESNGAGSSVDLFALTSFIGASGVPELTVTGGGEVIDPNLTTFSNVTITTDPTGSFTVPVGQTFSFPSGTTTINTGTVLDQGNLSVESNAILTVEGGLTINGQGGISVSSGSTVDVSGNLLGNTTDAAGFNNLGTVVFDGAGTASSPQLVEAMSQDLGNVGAGFNDNFAYGTLKLTANTYVEFVDDAANSPGDSPEAIYVNDLIVPAGATLNLDGLHLYAKSEQNNGTLISGGAAVNGEVYDDANDSGSLTSTDSGLAGWTVMLTNTATSSVYSTTTGVNGMYSLSGLTAGTYTLSEVVQAGFTETQPVSPNTYTIMVSPGQTVANENFGDYPTAAIGGKVYLDTNGDGRLDNGEPGLSDWTVQLLNSSSAVIATATTGSDGDYSFTNVLPGTYTVQVISQSGYVPSSPASVTVADGDGQSETVEFGEFVPVAISGDVFDDPTDSGQFSSGDTGLSGWIVELVQGADRHADNLRRGRSVFVPKCWPRKLEPRSRSADSLGCDQLAGDRHADERHQYFGSLSWHAPDRDHQRRGVQRLQRQRCLQLGRSRPVTLDGQPPGHLESDHRHGYDRIERQLLVH